MTRKISFLPFFLLPFLFLYSCQQGNPLNTANEIDPDDTITGRKVIALNSDSTPKIVYFYPTDAQGKPIGEHNREVHYLPGKKKYIDGQVQNQQRNGEWKSYFEDGKTIRSIANYVNNQLDGKYQIFFENGKTSIEGYYKEGKCDGKWIFYDEEGKVTNEFTTDESSIGCKGCPKCFGIKN